MANKFSFKMSSGEQSFLVISSGLCHCMPQPIGVGALQKKKFFSRKHLNLLPGACRISYSSRSSKTMTLEGAQECTVVVSLVFLWVNLTSLDQAPSRYIVPNVRISTIPAPSTKAVSFIMIHICIYFLSSMELPSLFFPFGGVP
jgi:hypothetical protein